MAIKHIYVNGTETNLDEKLIEGDPVGYLFEWVADICRNLNYTGEYGDSYINGSGGEGGDDSGEGCGSGCASE